MNRNLVVQVEDERDCTIYLACSSFAVQEQRRGQCLGGENGTRAHSDGVGFIRIDWPSH